MYEELPLMAHHLGSRATRIDDMTEALYWAIEETGLRLPPRRDIARRAHVSEATISRRFRESRSDETNLVTRLVQARRRTYPRGFVTDGWSRWLPEDDVDLKDVSVWLSCVAIASTGRSSAGGSVPEAVREAWGSEIAQLVTTLAIETGRAGEEATEEAEACAEIIHATLAGLSIRRALDPDLDHERSMALLAQLLEAIRPSPQA